MRPTLGFDFNSNLDYSLGDTDAIHAPFVIAKRAPSKLTPPFKIEDFEVSPGAYVTFKDNNFEHYYVCSREEAMGIVDPFLTQVYNTDNVIILLNPQFTTSVKHEFKIDPRKKEINEMRLKQELEELKNEDPVCNTCWHIRNNAVRRS